MPLPALSPDCAVFHESTKFARLDIVDAIKSRHQRCWYEKND
jgi:hypothetical protein